MNKRTYTNITKPEFEQALSETELDFEQVDLPWTKELVYQAESENGVFALRVFSSLDERTGQARDKGSDAIRTVIVHKESGAPVIGKRRTNRIQTWKKNLKQKVKKLADSKDEIKMCSECGAVMTIRENSNTGDKFYGCSNYPECTHTEPLNDA